MVLAHAEWRKIMMRSVQIVITERFVSDSCLDLVKWYIAETDGITERKRTIKMSRIKTDIRKQDI